jgi:hypothetical protein
MPRTHNNTGRSRKNSGDIMAAPFKTTTRPYLRNRIAGQFAPRLIDMLETPAYRVLSLSGRRVLDRIEIELAHHGGHDNGCLPVTYDDFERYGIDRHAIAPALREVEALGFVRITERGRAGNAEFRTPNKFRLTFRPTDRQGQTDEWRTIQTMEAAKDIASTARSPIRRGGLTNGAAKRTESGGGKSRFQCANSPLKSPSPGGENHHYGDSGEMPTTSIFRGGATVDCHRRTLSERKNHSP